jgi:hypothetical protein
VSRAALGVDLGTTHSALAAARAGGDDGGAIEVVPVPQLVAPGSVEDRTLLPSFLYLPHPDELPAGALDLPWRGGRGFVAGALARDLGAKTPARLVSSAKSWLSHPDVDRRSPLLPIDAPEDVGRLSPVDAAVHYLEHLRETWNVAQPDQPFAEQEIVLTVPASFDPAARELTAEAARRAGYEHLTLLEEPQAALYSWIERTGEAWREQLRVGDVVLVVDVGGGTSDFSLIAALEREGRLELHRIAVGDHILLGGDNMDLALAHVVRAKLEQAGHRLDAWQLGGVTHACRSAKERLLAEPDLPRVPIAVPSRGSRLIGGTLRTELERDEVVRTVLEGFFPEVDADARPQVRARTALTQLGLPYAQDAAVTRHLAAFLAKQSAAGASIEGLPADGGPLRPTALLLNGGVFRSPLLAERLVATLDGWLHAAGAPPVRRLGDTDVDLAVARGAAYYGCVRQGRGVRIRGGTARSYFVGIESAMPAVPGLEPPVRALCLAPFGMEEGTEAALPPQEFGLVVGEPVRFRFFGSTVRRDVETGSVLDDWEPGELEELPPIEAELPAEDRQPGEVVPVRLHAVVTEVGTLRLEAVPRSGERRWKVEFSVREQHE